MLLLGGVELSYNLLLFAGIAAAGPVFMAVGQVLIVPTSMGFEILENNGIPPHHTLMNYFGIALILLGFFILQDLQCTRRLFKSLTPCVPNTCSSMIEFTDISGDSQSTNTSGSADQLDVV